MQQTYNSITLNPFCSSNPSLSNIVKISLIVLLPHIAMLFVTKSYNSLILLACSILAAQLAQFFQAFVKTTKAFFSWAVILQAVLTGMFVPENYSPLVIFLIVFAVLFVQNMIFASFAQSWANTVVVTVIVLYLMNPESFPVFLPSDEYFTYSNAGARLFSEGLLHTASFDTAFTGFFNSVFYPWGISVPEGYISLFWDSQSTVPAFRFNALTLVASLILVSYKAADAITVYVFLFVYGISVRMFSLYPYGALLGGGDILLALFTGGTLFTVFFILSWFGTTPMTAVGKCIYGAIGGILMFFICGGGTSSAGALFTVMFLNVLSPSIQYLEDAVYGIKLNKILIREGVKEAENE